MNKSMLGLPYHLIRGILFNLLFLIYQNFFQQLVLTRIRNIVELNLKDYALGSILFIIIIIDFTGCALKIPPVIRRLWPHGDSNEKGGTLPPKRFNSFDVIIWALRTVISLSMLMFLAKAFHIDQHENLMFGLMILIVIKELVVFFMLFLTNFSHTDRLHPLRLAIRELCGDICILIYSFVAYTATIDLIFSRSGQITDHNIALTILNIVAASLLFLLLYLPLRFIYIFEERRELKRTKLIWFTYATIVLNLISAIRAAW